MTDQHSRQDPHHGRQMRTAGTPLPRARAAMILLHGRGGTAADILSLVEFLDQSDQSGFAYLAPEAKGNTWYPRSFLAPLASNEPDLSSALGVVGRVLGDLAAAGLPPERTILLGFSQGACLALEYAARHARRYGGVAGLSGGLIGPDGTPRDESGSLAGTPVFLGCSDVDPHIPKPRVDLTAEVLRGLGGDVTERIYPSMGHTINEDELASVRAMMAGLLAAGASGSSR